MERGMDSHTRQSTHLPQTKLLFRNRNRFLSLFMPVICCAMSPYWIAALVYSSFFFLSLPAPVPLSKSVNLFQNCMSSVGARAYGSILNQCTPTVCILRRFNFFPLFLLILMGMHLALSVTKDTPSQIWIPYIHGGGKKRQLWKANEVD